MPWHGIKSGRREAVFWKVKGGKVSWIDSKNNYAKGQTVYIQSWRELSKKKAQQCGSRDETLFVVFETSMITLSLKRRRDASSSIAEVPLGSCQIGGMQLAVGQAQPLALHIAYQFQTCWQFPVDSKTTITSKHLDSMRITRDWCADHEMWRLMKLGEDANGW